LFVFYGSFATFLEQPSPTHLSPRGVDRQRRGVKGVYFSAAMMHLMTSLDRAFEPRYPKNVWGFMIPFHFLL
jgi:hypothetical protein